MVHDDATSKCSMRLLYETLLSAEILLFSAVPIKNKGEIRIARTH